MLVPRSVIPPSRVRAQHSRDFDQVGNLHMNGYRDPVCIPLPRRFETPRSSRQPAGLRKVRALWDPPRTNRSKSVCSPSSTTTEPERADKQPVVVHSLKPRSRVPRKSKNASTSDDTDSFFIRDIPLRSEPPVHPTSDVYPEGNFPSGRSMFNLRGTYPRRGPTRSKSNRVRSKGSVPLAKDDSLASDSLYVPYQADPESSSDTATENDPSEDLYAPSDPTQTGKRNFSDYTASTSQRNRWMRNPDPNVESAGSPRQAYAIHCAQPTWIHHHPLSVMSSGPFAPPSPQYYIGPVHPTQPTILNPANLSASQITAGPAESVRSNLSQNDVSYGQADADLNQNPQSSAKTVEVAGKFNPNGQQIEETFSIVILALLMLIGTLNDNMNRKDDGLETSQKQAGSTKKKNSTNNVTDTQNHVESAQPANHINDMYNAGEPTTNADPNDNQAKCQPAQSFFVSIARDKISTQPPFGVRGPLRSTSLIRSKRVKPKASITDEIAQVTSSTGPQHAEPETGSREAMVSVPSNDTNRDRSPNKNSISDSSTRPDRESTPLPKRSPSATISNLRSPKRLIKTNSLECKQNSPKYSEITDQLQQREQRRELERQRREAIFQTPGSRISGGREIALVIWGWTEEGKCTVFKTLLNAEDQNRGLSNFNDLTTCSEETGPNLLPHFTTPEHVRQATCVRDGRSNQTELFLHLRTRQRDRAASIYNPDYQYLLCLRKPVNGDVKVQTKDELALLRIKSPTSVDLPPAGPHMLEPKLFVELKAKSNRRVISNALSHCCLAGPVNQEAKLAALEALGCSDGKHFMILLRSQCQYGGLYSYSATEDQAIRVCGNGPKKIENKMVAHFYK
ncbi:unnamed protein product [Echinostoma caproni]|uniref:CKK domain-containing protein n=1 Tax=Echinostoma caproni TaxID=27848 RepID=A0A183AK17_9TREM|nr:unnamed protein product [Echinostoma caproni]